jgi:DNA transformation protein and related proteins
MAADAEFVRHCLELLSGLGTTRGKRMFGGHGLYVDERFVALIANDRLYLKADVQARPAFEAAGSAPFEYTTGQGQRAVMAYWSAPDEALDSAALMRPWAQLALDSARRAATEPPARARRRPVR